MNLKKLKIKFQRLLKHPFHIKAYEILLLQALIGKSTSKETVYKVDLFAQFIDPFLSFSEKSLDFTILKVRIN